MTPSGWRLARSAPTTSQLLTLGLLSAVGPRTKEQMVEIYEALTDDGDPLQDERLIEMAARTAYEAYHESLIGCCEPSWDELPESHRERMRQCQRAVLALFRGEGK